MVTEPNAEGESDGWAQVRTNDYGRSGMKEEGNCFKGLVRAHEANDFQAETVRRH